MKTALIDIELTVEDIDATVDIGQLAALATKVGLAAIIELSPESERPAYRVRLVGTGQPLDGAGALAAVAFVHAYAAGVSGNDLLEQLRLALTRAHFPLGKPIQDVMEIGGGPDHEGH